MAAGHEQAGDTWLDPAAVRTAAHARRRGGYDPSRTEPSQKRPKSEECWK
ncbi:hypothetical protein ACFWWB_19635 [Streptomyces sp. NPDC058690]